MHRAPSLATKAKSPRLGRNLAAALACLLSIGLTSCGYAISQLRLKRHFKAEFVCPSAQVSDWKDGYRVEGCGEVAFYWCDSDDERHVSRTVSAPTRGQRLVASAALGVFELAFSSERCALDHHYSSSYVFHPDSGPDAKVVLHEVDRSYFRASARFEGGHVELWAPRKQRAYTLLKLFTDAPFSLAHGGVTFRRDGAPLSIAAMHQTDEGEAVFLLFTSELHDLGQSEGLTIVAPPTLYELDQNTRRELAKFEH